MVHHRKVTLKTAAESLEGDAKSKASEVSAFPQAHGPRVPVVRLDYQRPILNLIPHNTHNTTQLRGTISFDLQYVNRAARPGTPPSKEAADLALAQLKVDLANFLALGPSPPPAADNADKTPAASED